MKRFLCKCFRVLLIVLGACCFQACATLPEASPVYLALQEQPINLDRLALLTREDPHAKAPDGNSCLYHAVVAEKWEAAETLAANGARLTAEEIHALFTPYAKRTSSQRYRFLVPIFADKMEAGESGLPKRRMYTCVAGDTCVRIARKLDCTEQELRDVNPDTNFSRLKRGQKLNVPVK